MLNYVKQKLATVLDQQDRLRGYVEKLFHQKASKRSLYPNWQQILGNDWEEWQQVLQKAQGGPQVLLATSTGGHLPVATLESLLAVALTLRGAEVHILLCDEALPACQECVISNYPDQEQQEHLVKFGPSRSHCHDCFAHAFAMYRSLGLQVHTYSDYLIEADKIAAQHLSASLPLADIPAFQTDGLAVGEHAFAGALRFFARGSLDEEHFAEPILRRYLQAAILTTSITRRILQKYDFISAVFHHGIYVPQGLIGEVARHTEVNIVNWSVAYKKKCFIFSHDDTYHHTLMTEPVSLWEHISWNQELETQLMDYLKSRWHGTNDWIWFHERPQFDLTEIAKELSVDFSKPCVGLLTNVFWDAQLHYPANAFPNMLEWIWQTIDYFSNRPDLQLLIRVHPAEIRGTIPSRQLVVDEIKKKFPELPSNVFIIPPDCNISTYSVMLQCNAVIIYGTKTGVELSSMGIPIIVAGEAWIRNKGITRDAASQQEYFAMLDELPLSTGLDETTLTRARQYAYHFFFRRMIPLNVLRENKDWPPYAVPPLRLNELRPEQDIGLDTICAGILHKTDFVFPAEKFLKP
jgi:hypothetical protein